jgi:hypothetical protein
LVATNVYGFKPGPSGLMLVSAGYLSDVRTKRC